MHQKCKAELLCDEKLGGFVSSYFTDSKVYNTQIFSVISLLTNYSEVTQVGKIYIQPSCL